MNRKSLIFKGLASLAVFPLFKSVQSLPVDQTPSSDVLALFNDDKYIVVLTIYKDRHNGQETIFVHSYRSLVFQKKINEYIVEKSGIDFLLKTDKDGKCKSMIEKFGFNVGSGYLGWSEPTYGVRYHKVFSKEELIKFLEAI